jgi:hypothetical protein
VIHFRPGISDNPYIFGEEFVSVLLPLVWIDDRRTVRAYEAKKCWEGLLLRQITGSAKDDDDSIFFELDGTSDDAVSN